MRIMIDNGTLQLLYVFGGIGLFALLVGIYGIIYSVVEDWLMIRDPRDGKMHWRSSWIKKYGDSNFLHNYIH